MLFYVSHAKLTVLLATKNLISVVLKLKVSKYECDFSNEVGPLYVHFNRGYSGIVFCDCLL